jgi:hypothetical protein
MARRVTPSSARRLKVSWSVSGSGVDNPQGSNAYCRGAERGEELTHEIRHRTLSARAGDRHHVLGLARIPACCRQRQGTANIGNVQIGNGQACRGDARLPDNCHGARARGLDREGEAVRPGTRNRDEDVARPDLPAVERDPGHGQRAAGTTPRLRKEIGQHRRPHHRVPQAPSFVISGNGLVGGSKRGGIPRRGAARSMMLPVVGAVFQPDVAKP